MLPTDGIESIVRGSRVWVRQPGAAQAVWRIGEVTALDGAAATVALLQPPGGTLEAVPLAHLAPANPELQDVTSDLTQLTHLNEPALLAPLSERYRGGAIYTAAGPVLIALNPCKSVPLYTPELEDLYKACAHEALARRDPHVFALAAGAFRALVREGVSQSVVINGESGAGKTETTKKVMQFLAALAGGNGVEDQVLETNPILEAFGNAKTLRNHNSSRFGKLIEIHFSASRAIAGATVRTYLLEKSRVVHQLPRERSFHIFYQLVRGASADERATFRLPDHPTGFKYLAASGCTDIAGVDDVAEFNVVKSALTDLGVTPDELRQLWALLSGLLWLGNLTILPLEHEDGSRVVADDALDAACTLLGVSSEALCAALTTRLIHAPDGLIIKQLHAVDAVDTRDALAKAAYAGVFSWLVGRINARLDSGKRASGATIAILDIYGFEQFDSNSFEQLCINYANERLQQQFTRHLFTLEQQEYMAEGIDWTRVEWTDNQVCLDAIEAAPPRGLGLLAILDSQCRFPKSTDSSFLVALRESLASSPAFGSDPRRPSDFALTHFAGPVSYDVGGFLDKNRDALSADVVDLMTSSSHDLLSWVGAEAAAAMAATAALSEPGARAASKKSAALAPTVSSRFSTQLRELIAQLDTTGLHFVRCIKPNNLLQPDVFDAELVLSQLRCCGVLEVARVSRAGFPTRYPHAVFVERYKVLLPRAQQDEFAQGGGRGGAAGAARAARALVEVFRVPEGSWAMGHTKIFFRPGVLGYVEDMWARLQRSTLTLQAFARMHLARKRLRQVRDAAAALQAAWRGRAVRTAYADELARWRAAIRVQAGFRGFRARRDFSEARRSVVVIQMAARRRAVEKRVAARVEARLAREAAEAAAAAAAAEEARLRREAEEGFFALRDEYGITQLSEVRLALATYATAKHELEHAGLEQVAAAFALYATLQRALGDAAVAPGGNGVADVRAALPLLAVARAAGRSADDPAVLTQQLALAGVAEEGLAACGAAAAPEELRTRLEVAAEAEAALGGAAPPPRGEVRRQVALAAAAGAALAAAGAADASPEELRRRVAFAADAEAALEESGTRLGELRRRLELGATAEAGLAAGGAALATPSELSARLELAGEVRAALDAEGAAAAHEPGDVRRLLALAGAADDCLASSGAEATPDELRSRLGQLAAIRRQAGTVDAGELGVAVALHAAAARAGAHGPGEVCTALDVWRVAQGAGCDEPEALRAALEVAAATQGATPAEAEAAMDVYKAAQGHGITSGRVLAVALAVGAAEAAAHDRAAAETAALASAATAAGCSSPAELSQALAVARAAGTSSATLAAEAAALAGAAREAGVRSPLELTHALEVATAAREAGIVTPSQAAQAGATYRAACEAGVGDDPAAVAAGLSTLAGVGMLSRSASAAPPSPEGADATATPPIASPLSSSAASSPAAVAGVDSKRLKKALAMYALAKDAGVGDKRDFTAAMALYAALRREGLASPAELQAAVALFAALRQEGVESPEELHAAVATYTAAREALVSAGGSLSSSKSAVDPSEVRAALAAHRAGAVANGAHANGGAPAAEVDTLRSALAAEKVARQRYATRLEEQAAEWMEQVRVLKEYIDSLRARSAGTPPPPPPPLDSYGGGATSGSSGGGGGAASSGEWAAPARVDAGALAAVRPLTTDLSQKMPLFDDDAAFIREVVEGDALAPAMDAAAELEALNAKFEAWARQFKGRVAETREALRTAHARASNKPGAPDPRSMPDLAAPGLLGAPAAVDVRALPDLATPGLLEGGGGGGGGSKKKKSGGLFKGLLG